MTPTPDPLAPKNVLLLGYAGPGHDGPTLTDTMIVAHVEPREKKVSLISIPRDIWVPIPIKSDEEKNFKLNHAFAIGSDDRSYPFKKDEYTGLVGGGNMAKDVVSEVVGMPIDYFVSINFDGFMRIINILGGIEVVVPHTLDDEFYPIEGEEDNTCGKTEEEIEAVTATMSGEKLEQEFKCRFEHLYLDAGRQFLDSETALKFVRSRHSSIGGGDFGRSLRQQAFVKAIKNRLLSLGSITKIIPVVTTLSKNVQTDIDIKQAFDLYRQLGEIEDIEIISISLSTDNVLKEDTSEDRQFILVASEGWGNVHEYIQKELKE